MERNIEEFHLINIDDVFDVLSDEAEDLAAIAIISLDKNNVSTIRYAVTTKDSSDYIDRVIDPLCEH